MVTKKKSPFLLEQGEKLPETQKIEGGQRREMSTVSGPDDSIQFTRTGATVTPTGGTPTALTSQEYERQYMAADRPAAQTPGPAAQQALMQRQAAQDLRLQRIGNEQFFREQVQAASNQKYLMDKLGILTPQQQQEQAKKNLVIEAGQAGATATEQPGAPTPESTERGRLIAAGVEGGLKGMTQQAIHDVFVKGIVDSWTTVKGFFSEGKSVEQKSSEELIAETRNTINQEMELYQKGIITDPQLIRDLLEQVESENMQLLRSVKGLNSANARTIKLGGRDVQIMYDNNDIFIKGKLAELEQMELAQRQLKTQQLINSALMAYTA